MATIRYNQFVDDEIEAAGLTAVKSDLSSLQLLVYGEEEQADKLKYLQEKTEL